jgi:hypothetical protein
MSKPETKPQDVFINYDNIVQENIRRVPTSDKFLDLQKVMKQKGKKSMIQFMNEENTNSNYFKSNVKSSSHIKLKRKNPESQNYASVKVKVKKGTIA